jgi:hypothetical protein
MMNSMNSMSLKDRIALITADMAAQFTARLTSALKDASIKEIGALESAMAGTEIVDVTQDALPAAKVQLKALPASKGKAKKAAAGKSVGAAPSKGAKAKTAARRGSGRSGQSKPFSEREPTEETKARIDKVLDFLKAHPGTDGQELMRALRMPKGQWNAVRNHVVGKGQVRIDGDRRMAKYYLTAQN